MLKLFSAFDLFSFELSNTKTWGFPSIYFRGQVKVKCQCEEEGRIKSPIQYYLGIQCPVNTNKSVLLEFVGLVLLLKLRPHGKQLTISRCEAERTISSTEKLYFFSVRRATAAGIHRDTKRRQLLWEHERVNSLLPLATFIAGHLPDLMSWLDVQGRSC